MKRVIDTLSGDLFASIPQPSPMDPGAWSFRGEIANAMSAAIKACDKDRYQISADMSRILGREVSIESLNKFTSESSDQHMPSLERAIAFDAVTGQLGIISLYAAKLGCRVLPGKEVLKYELGICEKTINDAKLRARTINKLLGEE
jgi:hypothetical protein